MAGVYVVTFPATSVSAVKTLLQIKAGSATPLELLRAWIAVTTTPAVDSQQEVEILRKSAAATVTSFTPLVVGPRSNTAVVAAAAGSTTGTGNNASAEGTNGDILYPDAFNMKSGWLWLPGSPEERIQVEGGGIIALRLSVAPPAATSFKAGFVFRELQ
jgi:hypothetical protein